MCHRKLNLNNFVWFEFNYYIWFELLHWKSESEEKVSLWNIESSFRIFCFFACQVRFFRVIFYFYFSSVSRLKGNAINRKLEILEGFVSDCASQLFREAKPLSKWSVWESPLFNTTDHLNTCKIKQHFYLLNALCFSAACKTDAFDAANVRMHSCLSAALLLTCQYDSKSYPLFTTAHEYYVSEANQLRDHSKPKTMDPSDLPVVLLFCITGWNY